MPQVSDPTQIWEKVKAELTELLPKDIFESWFANVDCLEANDSAVVLQVANEFSAIWINDNYLDLLAKAFQRFLGYPVTVALQNKNSGETETAQDSNRIADCVDGRFQSSVSRFAPLSNSPAETTLNRRNTFENFVVGSNNQLAHAAAMAVAHAPAGAYNPLFVYGDTGLGKTHLMHAVGHHIHRNKPEARIAYLSSEKFTNEFISSIQENTLTQFRKRYRKVDVLFIDDVQFLSGKERIQEEFFHTFNELFEQQKQIFLSSDRPVNEIAKLENRLVSRFQWGLVTDIQAPDFETRVAILRKKAEQHNFNVQEDVINFIAEHIVKNIRRLEGALIKVCSYASLTGKALDITTCEMLLRDVLMEAARQQLTIDAIQKRVAEYFELRHSDMLSRRRPNHIAVPRQIAMYLSRGLTKHSLQEIGEAFGGRDHGTVIHACRQVENLVDQDDTVRHSVDYLKSQLSR